MRQWAWTVLAIAACGDGHGGVPIDGAVLDTAPSEMPIDAPPAYLVPFSALIDFGGVLVNRTSGERVVAFTNTTIHDTAPLSLALAGASPGVFQVVSTTCTGVLAPAASCIANVVLSPISTTTVTAALVLTDGVATATATVTGIGTLQTGIAISPTSHDFGYPPPGITITGSFTVSNTGNVTTEPLALSLSNSTDFFVIDDTCSNVPLGDQETCMITVLFRSYTVGVQSSSLDVTAGAVGPITASLFANCCAPPRFYVTPATQAFGTVSVGDVSIPHDFTLHNDWPQPTSAIMVSVLGNDPADFIVVADTCNAQIVAAHATCTISVAFRPTATGSRSASVSAFATAGGAAESALSGVGQ